MNEADKIVNAIGTQACEVINSVNSELSNIRAAVESMDSETKGELSSINTKLAGIYDVLEEIKDLLAEQKQNGKKAKTRGA
jgi:predicted transcriptional regulator with HTH domain